MSTDQGSTTAGVSSTQLTSLVIDACELIVQLLGAGPDAASLGTTCREWRSHVKHSDVWRGALSRFAPMTEEKVSRQLKNHHERDEFSVRVDWMAAVIKNRQNRLGKFTNFDVSETFSGGGWFASVKRYFTSIDSRRKNDQRVLMQGLDSAGKSTILYKLEKLGEVNTDVPTIGFSIETVQCKHFNLTIPCWDVGGGKRLRMLWRHYYQGAQGLIFVVDSYDRARIPEARDELHQLLAELPFSEAAVLIFANKQDRPNAMHLEEVAKELGLCTTSMTSHHPTCVQGCSAVTGDGLQSGLRWIHAAVTRRSEFRAVDQKYFGFDTDVISLRM